MYGKGQWKKISDEGWFDGRQASDLSEKYKNLEEKDHILAVTRRVMMLEAGRNPLKELRALHEQQPPRRRRRLSGGTTMSQGASSVLGCFGSSSVTISSDEGDAEPSVQHKEQTVPKQSSQLNTDASQRSVRREVREKKTAKAIPAS